MLVAGWRHQDIAEIAQRWPAQLNVCGLAVEDRPALVIGVRLSDLPRSVITHLDSAGFAVHWWWGVIDRLDTETRLAAISPRRSSPVTAAVITELSGWDLACTDHLARHWDRTTAGVPAALGVYSLTALPSPNGYACSEQPRRRATTAPPAELEQPWRAGLVERWGQSIRWAPHTLDDGAVAQRLWMAHNRILIPHVDEERSHYERMILDRATPQALAGLVRRDDDIIEIGSLVWLLAGSGIDIGREHRQRLHAFRDLRNELAHRRPVADDLLRRVVGYLEF